MITDAQFTAEYIKGFPLLIKLLRTRGIQDAEEIAQRAWTKAWINRATFQGRNKCKFLTWVSVIAFNEFRQIARCKDHTLAYVDSEYYNEQHDARIYTEQLLAKLPCGMSVLLRWHYIDDQCSEQPVPGSASKIKSRVHRARIWVRKLQGV